MRRTWAELRNLKLWLQFFGAGTLVGGISLTILVLLPATTGVDASAVIERLRAAWSGMYPDLTFSAGVADVGANGGAEAARQADAALYLAKDRGRDRTEVAGQPPSRSKQPSRRVAAER